MPKEFCTNTYGNFFFFGPYDTECDSVQSYCQVNGQTAAQNITSNFIENQFASITQGSHITPKNLEDIYLILYRIATFGVWKGSDGNYYINGTQNPTPTILDDLSSGEQALLSSYNKILNCMNFSTLPSGSLMSIQAINTLKNNIKAYKLNSDRCHTCNTSSNCMQSCDESGSGEGCNCWCQCGNCTGCESGWHD